MSSIYDYDPPTVEVALLLCYLQDLANGLVFPYLFNNDEGVDVMDEICMEACESLRWCEI